MRRLVFVSLAIGWAVLGALAVSVPRVWTDPDTSSWLRGVSAFVLTYYALNLISFTHAYLSKSDKL